MTARHAGGLEVEVSGNRANLAGSNTLAGSVSVLDAAVHDLARAGIPLPTAVAAVGRSPMTLLGSDDRGTIAVGQRADLVELDHDLEVRRVARDGAWFCPR